MKNILLASVAAITMVSQAEAQDSGYNWTGFYVGAQAGYGWSSAEFSGSPGLFGGAGLIPESDHDEDGFVGGIHAGYDRQDGKYVFGALVDVDFIDVDQIELQDSASFGPFDTKSEAYTYDIDWLATARVRAGFLPTERLLVYGTGGVAFAHVEATSRQQSDFFSVDDHSENSNIEVGGVIGLGAEFALARNWSVKTEYLHYDFNSLTVGTSEGEASFDPSVDTVKVGLSFRFGP